MREAYRKTASRSAPATPSLAVAWLHPLACLQRSPELRRPHLRFVSGAKTASEVSSDRVNDELTQAMIEDGMARAEEVACAPAAPRCYAFPDPLEDARQTCTPMGRCCIGWIVPRRSAPASN